MAAHLVCSISFNEGLPEEPYRGPMVSKVVAAPGRPISANADWLTFEIDQRARKIDCTYPKPGTL